MSEFKISLSFKSYNGKTAGNCYVAEKRIVFDLIAQIEDFIEDCFKSSRPYRLYFPINKPSKSVTVRSWLGRVESGRVDSLL